MKAIEFTATVRDDGQIIVPAEIANQLTPGESLRVVLQSGSAVDEDLAWRTLGRRCFEEAYAPEDSVYDQLIDETSTR
jgi:hypothetical protein